MSKEIFWRIPSGARVLIANIILICLVFEIIGVALYYNTSKELIYVRKPANIADFRFRPLNIVFNPYYGFAPRYDERYTNNHGWGFINKSVGGQSVDYPYNKKQNQVLIGVFGGSVAHLYFHYEEKNRQLASELEKLPQFSGREVVLLSFAFAGFKQPQQQMVYNYYLALGQHLDIVLSIDGFNEVAHGANNFAKGVPIAAPVDEIWGNLIRYVELRNLAPDGGVEAQWHRWAALDASRKAAHCRMGSCFLLNRIAQLYHDRRANMAEGASVQGGDIQATSHFVVEKGHNILLGPFKWPVADVVYETIGDIWANSIRAMNDLAGKRDAVFLEVLQPNLHFPRDRVFPPLDPADKTFQYFIDPVRRGYPVLIRRVAQLRKEGINAYDGTAIMDRATTSVLLDDCCHYNDAGNALLSSYLSQQIDAATRGKKW